MRFSNHYREKFGKLNKDRPISKNVEDGRKMSKSEKLVYSVILEKKELKGKKKSLELMRSVTMLS